MKISVRLAFCLSVCLVFSNIAFGNGKVTVAEARAMLGSIDREYVFGILEALARDQMETLLELALPVSQQAGDGAGLDTLCQYIDEHRSLWRVLLTGGASAPLRAELLRSSLTVARQKAIAHPSLPMELAATCSVALIIEVITWWLKQPEGAYSRNQVSQMLQQVLGQARLMEP